MKADDRIDPYLLHKACHLEETVSLAKVGELTKSELKVLKAIDIQFFEVGWPSDITQKDRDLNELYPINLTEAVKRDTFVLLGSVRPDETQSETLETSLISRFPELEDNIPGYDAFSSYFAHLHNDAEVAEVRGQINLILKNPLGHALVSKSKDGKYHRLVPKAGDIIFLDIHCEHAVISDQSQGFTKMRRNPMQAIFVSFSL